MRTLSDTVWAALGVAGALGGIRVMERLRPAVVADDVGAPDDQAGLRELPRAYLVSAGTILASPVVASGVRLPRWSGPLGLVVGLAGVGLRVWAMRTLQGHYAHALRVVDGQPVVRTGPYAVVRHPGYLGVLLLWVGAGIAARNALAPVLTPAAVGTAYRHRIEAEDALLRRDLPGYDEYAAGTPRLVPLVGRRTGYRTGM
ncbi:methyltransferase family protein [Actinomycetospora termitidis]|uniref:Isoprenylcysteine carboxylmethyltransferase family protein n=1 Tax=Actinomycetospora termitidis TaxID=3053470 RepID=A0ABT7M4M8_9PSEU|nr:isoprenylcysteine carboxylmethyltransferase family protein [Actinomycetospora sp. Odt1-22]MDL5155396.1 isoprenylcysteine carboxylmethyltransferase family protein [Actinomycetospora sp. Odt1-22]